MCPPKCVLLPPRMLPPVYGEEEGQCCDGPLSPGQLLHGAVTLARGDDVVVDAPTEGLLKRREERNTDRAEKVAQPTEGFTV